ncbi:hypothetical protein B484DRAFT_443604 [Ochromonadaceae sp. CCMP2298]|nr:hypothetical protein B484DRAFT_443604 [Ochromonadaceae sp. CCMP2298]
MTSYRVVGIEPVSRYSLCLSLCLLSAQQCETATPTPNPAPPNPPLTPSHPAPSPTGTASPCCASYSAFSISPLALH